METGALEARWGDVAAEALSGVAEWRQQHPTATLREIEDAVDEHLATLRARLVIGRCGPGESGQRSERGARGGAPGLCGVRGDAGAQREQDAHADDAPESADPVAAQPCGLPGVRGRAFSPAMRNWRWYPGS